jgi:hypothetical protein
MPNSIGWKEFSGDLCALSETVEANISTPIILEVIIEVF